MDEPDPATLRSAADGDRRAFESIVRAYQAPVWRFVRHLLGDDGLAEDVTQETFVRVHAHLRRFDGRSKFTTWLFQIARNAGIDAIRARQRQERLAPSPISTSPSPEAGWELRAALGSLAPNLRDALLTIEVLGLRYEEAGVVLGVPAGTVKSRVHRAREQLMSWMSAGEVAGEL